MLVSISYFFDQLITICKCIQVLAYYIMYGKYVLDFKWKISQNVLTSYCLKFNRCNIFCKIILLYTQFVLCLVFIIIRIRMFMTLKNENACKYARKKYQNMPINQKNMKLIIQSAKSMLILLYSVATSTTNSKNMKKS